MAAAPTTTLHLGIGVDTRDFATFVKALRKASPELRRELIVRLRGVGQVVADEAKARVEPYSKSIPPSIRVRVSAATVSVVAGGTGVPMAGLLELGSAKSRGDAETFSHPVFGNRNVWVKQSMHPYLGPAVRSKIDVVEQAAVDALDAVVDEVVRG